LKLSEFDYELPRELIAQYPAEQRDSSRLMVVSRKDRTIEHKFFKDLPSYLKEGDLLVLNDTKVIPARIFGIKAHPEQKGVEQGCKVEILLLKAMKGQSNIWECLLKPYKKVREGDEIIFCLSLKGKIMGKLPQGRVLIEFEHSGDFKEILNNIGHVPLPPYIKRNGSEQALDRERYQTIFARKEGSVAAPTAGLHFTRRILEQIKPKVAIATITLHIGPSTFQPIRVEEVEEHKMEPEPYEIAEDVAEKIETTKKMGGRVIAVGTTVTKTLESAASKDGKVLPQKGESDLFIFPGYSFKVVDAMITNFHLPKSSLLILVSAFAGRDLILEAYSQAIERRYRFYSYGDCMLII